MNLAFVAVAGFEFLELHDVVGLRELLGVRTATDFRAVAFRALIVVDGL